MENILLRYCRETSKYTVEQLAAALTTTPQKYIGLEAGEQIPTIPEIKKLAAFYKIDIAFFYESMYQHSFLRTKNAEVVMMEIEIEGLKKEVEQLTNSLHDQIRSKK